MMEGIWIAANRCLSPTHPIYKLLGPHFFAILAVNMYDLQFLRLKISYEPFFESSTKYF